MKLFFVCHCRLYQHLLSQMAGMGLDIGPDSIKTFNDALETTKTVIWNGPMGVFEFDKFALGTEVCLNFSVSEWILFIQLLAAYACFCFLHVHIVMIVVIGEEFTCFGEL